MNSIHKLLLACVPVLALAACGGGDTEDRLDVADPVVRFVHVAAFAPTNLTLFRGTAPQGNATNVSYKFGSNYFDVSLGNSDWLVKTEPGGATIGTVPIDPVRGTRYTVVALSGASSADTRVALIADPYNKPLGSSSAHLRVMNASTSAPSIDLYMTATTDSISGATPLIATTTYPNAGPASGNDSANIPGGTWKVTITAAGTKTILFQGQISFVDNSDVLLLTVPDTAVGAAPGSIKARATITGTTGANDVPVFP